MSARQRLTFSALAAAFMWAQTGSIVAGLSAGVPVWLALSYNLRAAR